MRTPSRARRFVAFAWLPATFLLGACAGTNSPSLVTSAAPPPGIQPDAIVGRWGLAAYQREQDRTRTEAEARRQCRQAYEIRQGPGGGVIMHLADQSEPAELRLKGAAGGKTFVGPDGEANDPRDREIVSFDGRIMVMRWVDPDVSARYGTSVYVRCDGPPPRVAQKRKGKSSPRAQQNPVFMAPPPNADPDSEN